MDYSKSLRKDYSALSFRFRDLRNMCTYFVNSTWTILYFKQSVVVYSPVLKGVTDTRTNWNSDMRTRGRDLCNQHAFVLAILFIHSAWCISLALNLLIRMTQKSRRSFRRLAKFCLCKQSHNTETCKEGGVSRTEVGKETRRGEGSCSKRPCRGVHGLIGLEVEARGSRIRHKARLTDTNQHPLRCPPQIQGRPQMACSGHLERSIKTCPPTRAIIPLPIAHAIILTPASKSTMARSFSRDLSNLAPQPYDPPPPAHPMYHTHPFVLNHNHPDYSHFPFRGH